MPDHVVDLLLPPLLDQTRRIAPAIGLDVVPWSGIPGPGSDLDFLIACAPSQFGGQATSGYVAQPLFSDTEAIGVRRSAAANRMARLLSSPNPSRVFREYSYAAVVGRGLREDLVDTWLREEHGIERSIGVVVPSYLQALHMAARSDLAVFVPSRLLDALAKPLGLRVFPSPIDPGFYHETLFQPLRTLQDPGANWLKGQILAAGARLDRGGRG
jgi:DNA-binding transcriptional LysR family regulator